MQSIEEIDQLPFFFIVAKGRSGTTLMQTMLDANSNVILPIESRLIIHLKAKYHKKEKWSKELIEELINDLYKDKKFEQYWAVDREKLKNNILSFPIEKLSYASICKIIYMSYPSPFAKEKILIVGDKNPIYSIFIPELTEVFPDAKFIHLVRDYRDNIVSNRQVFARKKMSLLAEGWKAYNQLIEKSQSLLPKNFYTLRYEDLVQEPSRYVPEICTFLGLTFNPSMLDFHKKIGEIKEEKYVDEIKTVHPNIVNPINTSAMNKWQKHLSAPEIEMADAICGEYAKRYGYTRTTHKKNLAMSLGSSFGRMRVFFDFWVIKSYYRLPFRIRDSIRMVTSTLYKWFRVTSYYNQADFRFKK